jgi:hypothetical protein
VREEVKCRIGKEGTGTPKKNVSFLVRTSMDDQYLNNLLMSLRKLQVLRSHCEH